MTCPMCCPRALYLGSSWKKDKSGFFYSLGNRDIGQAYLLSRSWVGSGQDDVVVWRRLRAGHLGGLPWFHVTAAIF